MPSPRSTALRTAAFVALAAGASAQHRTEVPDQRALTAAEGPALAAVVRQLHVFAGSDVWQTVLALQFAAADAKDPAARYLLLRRAVEFAEQQGHALAAVRALAHLGQRFAIDEEAQALALLQRIGERNEAGRASAALALLHRGTARVFDASDAAMTRHLEAALRAATLSNDPAIYDYLTGRLPALRAWHGLARELANGADVELADRCGFVLQELLFDRPLPALAVGDVAPLFRGGGGDLAARKLDAATAAELTALAARAKSTIVATALRQRAIAAAWLPSTCTPGSDQRQAIAATIAWTEAAAASRGVHALRFRDARDVGQLVIGNGDWRVVDGVLVGGCTGTENFATHRLSFEAVRSVVIRGGIRSEDERNFRCKVGDVNLLLNWEVRPENHLWHLGTCTTTTPPALQRNREHCLLFVQGKDSVFVCIDEQLVWAVPGASLAGTITVYPALGSEIFVREILVDGEPDVRADAPSGELK